MTGDAPLLTAARTFDRDRLAAMVAGDLDTLDALIADTALYIHSTGEVDTKTDYLAKLTSGQFRYATATAQDHRVTELGSAVALTYRIQAEVVFPAGSRQISARATAVWRQFDDGIRLTLFHSTALQPEE
ncbi:nuclear transport factor 2 family protein [Rhodococcus opacus]|uniref:nuclear transport factor 2 family protein n=1 Tax=Rhodococcus opacus TaxID=37919 RepID=UPI001C43EBA0|nr:nuclear transport factor 2 family protein [Rhodococcus opacus]MBV6756431.1 nuclear transport factor 2 family protein [Rhodococcus opacus]